MTDNSAERIAVEASAPGKFSLIDRLRSRNYPSEDVDIYLAEDAAYTKARLEEQAADIRIFGTDEEKAEAQAKLDAINARIAQAKQAILDSKVVINITGISSERFEELRAESAKKFPVKYEKVMNPLTGKATPEEIASPDREELLDNLYMGEVITKATIGNDVDDEIDAQWFKDFKVFAPLDAIRVLVSTAFKMRMAVEWMDELQNEDF